MGLGFRCILTRLQLTPQPCHVFSEDLTYFFYGRAAYRVNSDEPPTELLVFPPICFVLKPDCISTIERIYPFDSGAFKYYEDYMYKDQTLASFSLHTGLDVPQRVVTAFFGSNERYYYGKAVDSIAFDPLDYEVECYHALIKNPGKSIHDDRRSSIEIQTKVAVTLSKDTVLAVVLPISLYDSPQVKNTIIREWKAKALTYPSYHMKTEGYVALIYDRIEKYLRREKLL
jgi:hypothetical protein